MLEINNLQYDAGIFQENQSLFLDFLTDKNQNIEDKITEVNKFLQKYRAKLDSIDTNISQLPDAIQVALGSVDTQIQNAQWDGNDGSALEGIQNKLQDIQHHIDSFKSKNSQIVDQIQQLEDNTRNLSRSLDE